MATPLSHLVYPATRRNALNALRAAFSLSALKRIISSWVAVSSIRRSHRIVHCALVGDWASLHNQNLVVSLKSILFTLWRVHAFSHALKLIFFSFLNIVNCHNSAVNSFNEVIIGQLLGYFMPLLCKKRIIHIARQSHFGAYNNVRFWCPTTCIIFA